MFIQMMLFVSFFQYTSNIINLGQNRFNLICPNFIQVTCYILFILCSAVEFFVLPDVCTVGLPLEMLFICRNVTSCLPAVQTLSGCYPFCHTCIRITLLGNLCSFQKPSFIFLRWYSIRSLFCSNKTISTTKLFKVLCLSCRETDLT